VVTIPAIVVNAGKELVLGFQPETSVTVMNKAGVNANTKKGLMHEMAVAGTRKKRTLRRKLSVQTSLRKAGTGS
jgi:hypothetical protein